MTARNVDGLLERARELLALGDTARAAVAIRLAQRELAAWRSRESQLTIGGATLSPAGAAR